VPRPVEVKSLGTVRPTTTVSDCPCAQRSGWSLFRLAAFKLVASFLRAPSTSVPNRKARRGSRLSIGFCSLDLGGHLGSYWHGGRGGRDVRVTAALLVGARSPLVCFGHARVAAGLFRALHARCFIYQTPPHASGRKLSEATASRAHE
jgi:hypothetical protein